MPPRIPIGSCVRAQPSCGTSLSHSRLFSCSSSNQAKKKNPSRRSSDVYAAEYRKSANIARQAVLRQAREDSLGDPVVGIPTTFVKSFDTAVLPADTSSNDKTPDYMRAKARPSSEPQFRNHFVREEEATQSVWDQFRDSTRPVLPPGSSLSKFVYGHEVTPKTWMEILDARVVRHYEDDERAREAASRILALDKTGSHKQLYRVNIQRCIEKFGRHKTDQTLRPRPNKDQEAPPPIDTRGGPDTGSSEVQVAILTAKIRTLHEMMQKTNQDKHNKRNLRLLVHRRQKLLAYLRRKEKGGPRWQHLMDTLGLTDGSWKGEITM